MRGFYAAADVVLAPSRYESFGLVPLEAMMFARAVIGCRAGGMPEVIEDGVSGLLAEPGNAASLAGCVERLLDDPGLRSRMGKAGRARYERLFTARHMAAGVRAVLLGAGT